MKTRILIVFAAFAFFTISCKKETSQPTIEKTEVKVWKPEDTRALAGVTLKRGLISKTDMATPGYVLFSPSFGTDTYLMNLDGKIVHDWKGELNTMLNGYLLENGHLMRLERDKDFPTFAFGGQAGRIREYDWDGNLP